MNTTPKSTTVGTVHVPAGTIHDASYECAAWYRTFTHPAQTVEVRMSGEWILYTIQGRTTHEHFPSLWGGVAIGGGTMGDCNKPSTYHVQLYNYVAAAMVEQGKIDLSPGFRIQETYFDHPVSCMGYVTSYNPTRYSPCPHEVHEDAHYRPTLTTRNDRGFLPFGYAPGVKDRKRHVKIVAV